MPGSREFREDQMPDTARRPAARRHGNERRERPARRRNSAITAAEASGIKRTREASLRVSHAHLARGERGRNDHGGEERGGH